MLPIEIEPIGVVVGGPTGADGSPQRQIIKLHDRHQQRLLGIEECEHLWVLYWMSELAQSDRAIARVHPRGDPDIPLHGVFATHSQMRPNPIGMTRVRLIARDGTNLTVEGLDALDGTPVLDIKSG